MGKLIPVLDCSAKAWKKLWNYINGKLKESKVIPEHAIFRETARIINGSWRQPNRYERADALIKEVIMFPPPSTDKNHFSLAEYIKNK